MNDSAKFWDKFAEKYAKSAISDQAAYEEKLRRTQALFTPETRVLEIGCGTGSTAILHAPHVAHIDAADVSPKMIDIAKGKLDGISNITFHVADTDAALSEAQSPDIVMAMSLLHLVPHWPDLIKDIYAKLPAGGYFVSSTACLRTKGFWFIPLLLPIMRLVRFAPPFVGQFTPKDLQGAMTDAGFEIMDQWQPKPRAAVFIIARKPA